MNRALEEAKQTLAVEAAQPHPPSEEVRGMMFEVALRANELETLEASLGQGSLQAIMEGSLCSARLCDPDARELSEVYFDPNGTTKAVGADLIQEEIERLVR